MTQLTPYPGLDAEFSEYLRARAVPEDIAVERGYRLVRQGKPIDGDYAASWGLPRKSAGMLIPLHGILDASSHDSVQLRISSELQPDFTDAKGRPLKFLSPTGQSNVLVTAPRTRARLSEPEQGFIIAEGVTRIDALAAYDIPAVGTTGIWNWRSLTALPDFEAIAIKGNRIVIAPDGDVRTKREVFTAVQRLMRFLKGKGADSVLVVALPGGQGLDDWIANNAFGSADKLLHAMREFETDRLEPPSDPPSPLEGEIQDNPHYRLLGLAGDEVAFWISAGRILTKTRESLTQPSTLISIAPQEWWCRLAEMDLLGTTGARRIGDSLIRAADDLGQVDLERRTGRGAALLDNGTVVYHLGDRVLVDEHEIRISGSLNGAREGLDERFWLAEAQIKLGAAASEKDMRQMAKAVMAYRWASPEDGRRMLGWMVVALIGGALEWRPHLILTAPSSVGKSWLVKQVIGRLMGPLLTKVADATPAALARKTDVSSLPIAIDEAEPSSPWVMEVFKLLRVASGGDGMRLRADGATGGVVGQQPRFTALLSCTAMPALQQADETRMTVVRLGDEVDDWPAVQAGIREAMKRADAVRYRIIRRAPEIVADAARIADEFQQQGMDSRESLASAALTAGWHAWGLDQKDVYSKRKEHDDTPDGVRCLLDILALPFRTDSGLDYSMGDALRLNLAEGRLGGLYGLMVTTVADETVLAINTRNSYLKKALARTPWDQVNLRPLLLQIKGAFWSPNTLNFGSERVRGVVIPKDVLAVHGIELGDASGEKQKGF